MYREFREMQKYLDHLHKLRKEMMEVFRLPLLFQKKKRITATEIMMLEKEKIFKIPPKSIKPKWKLWLMSLMFWKYKKIKIDDPDKKRKIFMLINK